MSRINSDGKGVWRQVAAVIDGKEISIDPGVLLTVDADGYTVTVNGKAFQKGTSKNDYSKTPYQSDVIVTEGPEAGKVLRQIFTIEGDVLIACIAPAGTARPAEFASLPGSGHTLSVWLRTSDVAATQGAATSWTVLGLVVFLSVASVATAGLRQDLEGLAYWFSLVTCGLVSAFAVMVICLVLKWGWRAGLALGLPMSVGINTFVELEKTIKPAVGPTGAVVVSASTACVAMLVLGRILTRLLKPNWPSS